MHSPESQTISRDSSTPKVSVCIPTYNYGEFLPDAVESVLAQTFQDFELVVVDNCSTDNTCQIVQNYADRDPRVRYVCNEINVGAQENLNRCIRHARGTYLKILCADDLLTSDCLERMVAVFDTCPGAALVVSGRLLVDTTLRPLRASSYSLRFKVYPAAEVVNRCLFNGNYIGEPSAVLFRRADALRGFDTSYAQLIDLEMWFHLLEKGGLASIPDCLCKFRQHERQETRGNRKAFIFLAEEERFYRQFSTRPPAQTTWLRDLAWRIRIAHYIWRDRMICGDRRAVRAQIDAYLNYYLFLAVAPLYMGCRKLFKIADALLLSLGI